MTPDALLARCAEAGVSVHLDGNSVRMKGAREAVRTLLDLMRENRAAVIAHLANTKTPDLVAEFMEVDGLNREDAEAMASISVQPRSPSEWASILLQLDQAIGEYFERFSVSAEMRRRVLGARARQSLASVPATLAWFKCQLCASATNNPAEGARHDF